jgi:hypothetical protein
MITAMTTVILILALAAVVALIRVAWWALVDNDGYGRPDRARTAPRSHVPDSFDPRSRFA